MKMTKPAQGPSSGGLATRHAPPLDLPFRFMATGLGWLALMALLYPFHLPLLLGSFYSPHLLVYVHVNTLGLVAAMIMGASYQLLPVVLQSPLASVRLCRLSWWLYLPGLLVFLLGIVQGWPLLIALGGALLYMAIAIYVGIVAVSLMVAQHRDVVYWHLVAAVAGLAVAVSFGVLLAVSKAAGFLGALALPALGAHVVLMIAGWVAPMVTGVAYRLVGMFTLSEDQLQVPWAWAELGLIVGGAWTLAGSLLFGFGYGVSLLSAFALLLGVVVFLAQLLRLYRRRRRRTFDVHIPFALTSAIFGLLAAGLVAWGFATGRALGDPVWMAAGWLAIAGCAETAIQGFLYKIGTFLTWLHRYAPVAGRQPVPKLEDLYSRRVALVGWGGWTVGVGLAGLAALTEAGALANAAAGAMSLGAAAFLINAVRVGSNWRATPTLTTGPTDGGKTHVGRGVQLNAPTKN